MISFIYILHYNIFILIIHIFFFSSRRRHTRLQGDWSSDVCSSDLEVFAQRAAQGEDFAALARELSEDPSAARGGDLGRSEERRVGKGCGVNSSKKSVKGI